MNRDTDVISNTDCFELIHSVGFEGMLEVFTVLLNQAMVAQRSEFLGASPYERSANRKDYANGFKPKTITTTNGKTTVQVPQVRSGEFYPTAIDKGIRSERAFKVSLAEMYIAGVSTRKVSKIFEEMCGFEVSSTQLSRASQELDDELEKWRNRPLGDIKYLLLDARYEKVRSGGLVRNCAVFVAVGVMADGRRSILGVSSDISEAEVHWRGFLKGLVERGLHGVECVTSDDHEGLKKAVRHVFPNVKWQRCQTHLQRNAVAYITKKTRKAEVAEDIRASFNAKDLKAANQILKDTVLKYEEDMPRLSSWMEDNIPESLTVFYLPKQCWRKLRTSNGIERFNREIKRRTSVVSIFPNKKSLLRLVSAICVEISDEWECGDRRYINFDKENE